MSVVYPSSCDASGKSIKVENTTSGENSYFTGHKVGIGATDPGYVLDINGRSRVRGAGTDDGGGFWLTNHDAPTTNKSFMGRGTDSEDFVGFYTAGGWKLVIPDSSGYVGIGNTAPEEMLDVKGNIKLSGNLPQKILLGDSNAEISFESTDNLVIHNKDNQGPIRFKVEDSGTVELMTLRASMHTVGINNDAPIFALDVVGDIRAENGTYNGGHLLLGNYHIWVDTSGRLRIKNGPPGSQDDGDVVGDQTE